MHSTLTESAARAAIASIVRTILDPFGKRSIEPQIDVHGTTSFRAVVRVESNVEGRDFRRDGRGATKELALARLLLKVEEELADRVSAGQERLESASEEIRIADRMHQADAAVRKAVG